MSKIYNETIAALKTVVHDSTATTTTVLDAQKVLIYPGGTYDSGGNGI